MQRHPLAFRRYKKVVCTLGLVAFIGVLFRCNHPTGGFPELLVFFGLILAAELLPVKPAGAVFEVAMTLPVVFALFLTYGPALTVVVSTLSLFAAFFLMRRDWPRGWLLRIVSYNTSMHVLSLVAASVVYTKAGGITLAGGLHVADLHFGLLAVLWVLVYTMVNVVLFATGLSLYTSEPWRLVAAQQLVWSIPNNLVTAPSGVLYLYLHGEYGIYGILLMLVPFLVGRQAFNQYAAQLVTYRETITSLGSYMQHYHPYTKGHLERVADMAEKVAIRMGLPLKSLMYIRDAGLLHDIGKVGVSEEILDKTSKLTDEEWAAIKQHPNRGAEILSRMKYLDCMVPWIRGHHERPDGKGYPEGLSRAKIPIEASVISVVDAFDAMTGGPDEKDQRVYRTPLTVEQAVAQLHYGAGTQFNARVVRTFLKVIETEVEIDA